MDVLRALSFLERDEVANAQAIILENGDVHMVKEEALSKNGRAVELHDLLRCISEIPKSKRIWDNRKKRNMGRTG